uniref:Capsid protein n=1 Tax=Genomoviridae sp. TaxID=2202565 RepID=A0A858NMG4_9VIRU|nr:MAG: capsid protein [Genomoviridae sp.]
MPYRTTRRSKRSYTRRSSTRRRSYAPRRRVYRKRTYTKRPMTKRRILDTTSIKKRDTMLCFTNSTAASQQGGTTYTNNAAVVTGGLPSSNAATFLWCATARDNTVAYPGGNGTRFNSATRTSSSPYMIGLKENIEIQSNNGMPWQWRRICFTSKGSPIVANSATSPAFANWYETSNGYTRVMNQIPGNPGTNPQYLLMQNLFRGQIGSDWIDPITAPADNSNFTIKYDKVTSLAAGNEEGFIRQYKRWHPMNKTLVYADDEVGGAEQAVQLSSLGKAGMGDYYVLDIFRAREGSATSDQLTIRPTSTLYWHEK